VESAEILVSAIHDDGYMCSSRSVMEHVRRIARSRLVRRAQSRPQRLVEPPPISPELRGPRRADYAAAGGLDNIAMTNAGQ
jgi:hypothetical protein